MQIKLWQIDIQKQYEANDMINVIFRNNRTFMRWYKVTEYKIAIIQ